MKVSLVIGSRANWGRSRTIALAAAQSDSVELDLILMGSAIDEEFGSTAQDVQADGFDHHTEIPLPRVNNDHKEQAFATAVALERLTEAFDKVKPDFVITIADRFETMATAIAATYSDIKLAHVQGGEISGNIDDRVRNAISMLADIHFPSTALAANRLKSMVKNTDDIYMLGCPAMDTLRLLDGDKSQRFVQSKLGSDYKKSVCVCVHPNTEDLQESETIFAQIIEVIETKKDYGFIVLKPNIDAGNLRLRRQIEILNDKANAVVINGLSPLHYAEVLQGVDILVGNSSSFIRESAFLGKPAILLGDRQRGRDLTENVMVLSDIKTLQQTIEEFCDKNYSSNSVYGDGFAGEKILQTLIGQVEAK